MQNRTIARAFWPLAAFWALAGCADDDGPFEQFGEEIDEAAEDIQAGGETPANQIDDAIDEVEDTVEDAADEL
jgi:hypothetical protein